MLCPSSPGAGGESASGHLGRPPTSWPGGPHFSASAHYILQQTLDGAHPLEKTEGKHDSIQNEENLKSMHRYQLVNFHPHSWWLRRPGVEYFSTFKAPSSLHSTIKPCISLVCAEAVMPGFEESARFGSEQLQKGQCVCFIQVRCSCG